MNSSVKNTILFHLLLMVSIGIVSFTYLFLIIFKIEFSPNVSAATIEKPNITNSVYIGEYHFFLFGYTSPFALVSLEGQGIYEHTYADEKGYFEFRNRFSPFSPREACLTAQDQLGRLSVPLCLPPFPTRYDVTIGPVILPPTLSADKNTYYIGNSVSLSGQSIPNNIVQTKMYAQKNTTFKLPSYDTKTDRGGNYSLSLPIAQAQKLQVSTNTNYLKYNSPPSLQLHVNILPIWMVIINIFITIFSILKNKLLETLLTIEFISIAIYILHKSIILKSPPHELMIRPQYSITVVPYHHFEIVLMDIHN